MRYPTNSPDFGVGTRVEVRLKLKKTNSDDRNDFQVMMML